MATSPVSNSARSSPALLQREASAAALPRAGTPPAGAPDLARRPVPADHGETPALAGVRSESLDHARPSQARVRANLDRLEFAAPPGPEREAQKVLEDRYVDWVATQVVEPRRKAFGESRYRLAENTPAFGKGAVPAVFQFASRSPVAGAVTNHLAPKLKAVDLKALVPDPGPVQLRIVDGRKHYEPLDAAGASGDGASASRLKAEAASRRESVDRWQSLLEGKGEAVLTQPVLSGLMNKLRRATAASDAALRSAGKVFLGSLWASGTGHLLAQLERQGQDSAPAADSRRSGSYRLQQFGQSASNDLVWQSVKDFTKNAAYDLAGSLDRRRDAQQAGWLRDACRGIDALPGLAAQLEGVLRPQAPLAQALAQLRTLSRDQDIPVDTLKAVRAALASAAPGEAQAQHAALMAGLDAVLRPMARREALMRWRGAADRSR